MGPVKGHVSDDMEVPHRVVGANDREMGEYATRWNLVV